MLSMLPYQKVVGQSQTPESRVKNIEPFLSEHVDDAMACKLHKVAFYVTVSKPQHILLCLLLRINISAFRANQQTPHDAENVIRSC